MATPRNAATVPLCCACFANVYVRSLECNRIMSSSCTQHGLWGRETSCFHLLPRHTNLITHSCEPFKRMQFTAPFCERTSAFPRRCQMQTADADTQKMSAATPQSPDCTRTHARNAIDSGGRVKHSAIVVSALRQPGGHTESTKCVCGTTNRLGLRCTALPGTLSALPLFTLCTCKRCSNWHCNASGRFPHSGIVVVLPLSFCFMLNSIPRLDTAQEQKLNCPRPYACAHR